MATLGLEFRLCLDTIEAAAELLSPNDSKVLKLILEGLPEEAVAKRLKIADQTVH